MKLDSLNDRRPDLFPKRAVKPEHVTTGVMRLKAILGSRLNWAGLFHHAEKTEESNLTLQRHIKAYTEICVGTLKVTP